ncbi:dihydroorotate dehydrogenase [Desertibacillus haloalkaliphilus]|uniref:dihydroorotate dehydrogenase n=1 Tax=Desertibacillus haloalkaliphilus TaxID=1328930 RepID=UPI001FEACC8C|nr:dihydroorotate dehydrogenase [Desertibacillus haloalkaliphilus]
MKPPKELEKELDQTRFPSPVGLSGHIDPSLSGTNAFQELGFGFIEIGPIVLNKPNDEREPIKEDQLILFSEQEEKVPLKLAIKKLTTLDLRIPIIARIDPHVKSREWDIIVQHLTPFIDAFIGTQEQISTCVEKDTMWSNRSFYVSMDANEQNTNEADLGNVLKHSCLGGIVVNVPRKSKDGYWHEVEHANEILVNKVKQLKDRHPELPVITSGGVETPEEAYSLLRAGADLLILTDGYVKAGPGLPKRIHERFMYENASSNHVQRGIWSLLFGLSILVGGIIAFYFSLTRIILPYDESFIGLTRTELSLINPMILPFMLHDRMSLAGTMISGGILYIQVARHGIQGGLHWAKVAFHSAAIIGFLGIFLFIGFGYFDWLHGLFWLILLPIYYFSYKEGKTATGSPYSIHGHNDRAWTYGLYGQLMFILLGSLILIGGIVISTIGVTSVFVSTDLTYLCMTPDMLDRLSSTLIPVIAHDRAGFGSALVSVGMLVLMISLWGFRKGERWIWNTLAIGALPAFIAGIGTHFYIGYTSFIHLLPVYVLVFLYLAGLVLSYPFLKRKR